MKRNIFLNEVTDCCTVAGLDIYQQSSLPSSSNTNHGWIDMNGKYQDSVDVVLVTDMICRPDDAVAAAITLAACLTPGGIAYSICPRAKHRFGVDYLVQECHRVGLVVIMTPIQDLSQSDLDQTSGYSKGMNHDFYSIHKPSCW